MKSSQLPSPRPLNGMRPSPESEITSHCSLASVVDMSTPHHSFRRVGRQGFPKETGSHCRSFGILCKILPSPVSRRMNIAVIILLYYNIFIVYNFSFDTFFFSTSCIHPIMTDAVPFKFDCDVVLYFLPSPIFK